MSNPRLKANYNNITKQLTLSWNKIKYADKIRIYRRVNNGKSKVYKTLPGKRKNIKISCGDYNFQSNVYRFWIQGYYTTDGIKIYSENSKIIGIGK